MLTKLVKKRLYMLAVLGLFIAPVALSVLLVWGPEEWRPAGMANHGTLINPPQPFIMTGLQAENGGVVKLEGKWTLIVIDHGARCLDACRQALHDTRQIRLATGKDIGRVRRLYISQKQLSPEMKKLLLEQHPELLMMRTDSDWNSQFIPRLKNPLEAGRVYLVDPHGLLMMYFPAGLPAKGLLKDLQRLMKVA